MAYMVAAQEEFKIFIIRQDLNVVFFFAGVGSGLVAIGFTSHVYNAYITSIPKATSQAVIGGLLDPDTRSLLVTQ